MAFHVVSSFLLQVLASKITLWMAGIFQQPIRCFNFMVFEANTRSKMEDTTWKAMKSWARKCYIFLCTIKFEVTWPFWNMCFIYEPIKCLNTNSEKNATTMVYGQIPPSGIWINDDRSLLLLLLVWYSVHVCAIGLSKSCLLLLHSIFWICCLVSTIQIFWRRVL